MSWIPAETPKIFCRSPFPFDSIARISWEWRLMIFRQEG
jgi:hypothetical protein